MGQRNGLGPEETKYEKFRQLHVERFNNEQRQAKDHDAGRNQAVAEFLCYLSLIRNANLLPKHTAIANTGAKLQSVRSSGGAGTEWAHCLPSGLSLNNIAIDRAWALGLPPKIEFAIKQLFAHTTTLPKVFNEADTEAERSGLRSAFVNACRKVLQQSRAAPNRHPRSSTNEIDLDAFANFPPMDRAIVRVAYDEWRVRAGEVYAAALDLLQAKSAAAPIHEKARLDEQMEILKRYQANTAVMRPSALLDSQMDGLEREFGAL